jgi:cell shape-determining protein MreC
MNRNISKQIFLIITVLIKLSGTFSHQISKKLIAVKKGIKQQVEAGNAFHLSPINYFL